VVQCFPPLLKNAGGVSKRYLSLCRALIDGLGWHVSLLTQADVTCSHEPEVDRWLQTGSLEFLPAYGGRVTSSTDGVAFFLDLASGHNVSKMARKLMSGQYDAVFTDDALWRVVLLLLARGLGVPVVATTHTDITHMQSYQLWLVRLVWKMHMLSTRCAAVHAATSRVFGEQLQRLYGVPIGGVWPPCLWSPAFRKEPNAFAEEAQAQRALWLQMLRDQGSEPKAIMLHAGRWSAEKRIHLLFEAVPADCALVIVGDGTSEYADLVDSAGKASNRRNVLPLRKMLSAHELRVAYQAADLFLTASDFESLGFTVIESWCSGTPVAIQPAQGHLEFVKDGVNSWFVNYDDQAKARATLESIVAVGLDKASLHDNIPEFAPMGKKFRTSDYAQDLDDEIIAPALAQGAVMQSGGVSEYTKRLFSLVGCFGVWLSLWIFTRIAYTTVQDPKFELLGRPGSASDSTPCNLTPVDTLPPKKQGHVNDSRAEPSFDVEPLLSA